MEYEIYSASELREMANNFETREKFKGNVSLKTLTRFFGMCAENGHMSYTATSDSVVYNSILKYENELLELGFKITYAVGNSDKVHHAIISWEE